LTEQNKNNHRQKTFVMSLLGNTEKITDLWMEMTGKMHTLHSTSINQAKKITELRAQVNELQEQLGQTNKKEIEELTKSRDAWQKSFERRDKEVKSLLEFREGVADALELSNPDIVEPDDVSNKICELTDELDDERTTCHQLKVFAMKVHNQVYGTNYDDEDIATSFDYDVIIGKMIDDEDEKDKEIEKLKEELEWKKNDLQKEVRRNEELKKVIKETKRSMGHSVSDTEEEEEQ